MKERLTITLDKNVLSVVDKKIDGHKIKNRSHAIEVLLMQTLGNNHPKYAFILAGGLGTRLRPITHEIPKPLVPIQGKPIIEHLIDLFRKYDIRNIIVSIGHMGGKIKNHLGDGKKFGVNITYVEEEERLGTAGPLRLAENILTDSFIVTNVDELKDIDLHDMYFFHKEIESIATIALTTVADPSTYGVADMQGSKILKFVEKPKKENTPSNLINAGIYIFEPEIFDYIPKSGFAMLEKDVFPKLAVDNKLCGYPFSGQWFDTGTMERYEKAIKEWKGLD